VQWSPEAGTAGAGEGKGWLANTGVQLGKRRNNFSWLTTVKYLKITRRILNLPTTKI
jgi:hypothetical protein